MADDREVAKQWRKLAEELRAAARIMSSDRAKRRMLDIADEYERAAEDREQGRTK